MAAPRIPIRQSPSRIDYDYATVRLTQGRVDKGLIAIPKGLAHLFPARNGVVHVYLDNSNILQPMSYSSFDSSTKECRVGGLRRWFDRTGIKSGDEIVIQVIDKSSAVYRFALERTFVQNTQRLQSGIDTAKHGADVLKEVSELCNWVNVEPSQVFVKEFARLARAKLMKERRNVARESRVRESVPSYLKVLFERVYKGHCQICDFWFMKRDGNPYYEMHHIRPDLAHHPKNLLVVCGNCHNQFEFADVETGFDQSGWLKRVRFNDRWYKVFQILLEKELKSSQKTLYF